MPRLFSNIKNILSSSGSFSDGDKLKDHLSQKQVEEEQKKATLMCVEVGEGKPRGVRGTGCYRMYRGWKLGNNA